MKKIRITWTQNGKNTTTVRKVSHFAETHRVIFSASDFRKMTTEWETVTITWEAVD